MDPLTASLEVAMTDARRAAISGAIGDEPDRDGALILGPIPGLRSATVPSASRLSVAIDGPGLFIFSDRGKQVYGRLGDLRIDANGWIVDGRGRAILGSSGEGATARSLFAIRVPRSRAGAEIAIDEDGYVSAGGGGRRTVLARIPLAFPAAPERMARHDDTTAVVTERSGPVRLCFPGDANAGCLKSHVLETGLVDLQGDLARMWRIRRDGEAAAARAYASDECVRDALGLVR